MSADLHVKGGKGSTFTPIVVPSLPVFERAERFTSLTGLLGSTIGFLETFKCDNAEELIPKVTDLNYPTFKALVKTFHSFQKSLEQFTRSSDIESRKELDALKPTIQALHANIETLQREFAPIISIFKDCRSLERSTDDLLRSMHAVNSMTALQTKLLALEPFKTRINACLDTTPMSSKADIRATLEKLQHFEDLLSFTQNTPSGTLCLFYQAMQVYHPNIHGKAASIFNQLDIRDRQAILRYLQADCFPDELTSQQASNIYKIIIGKTILEERRDQLLKSCGVSLSELKSNPQLITQHADLDRLNQMVISSAVISPSSWDRLYGLYHCTEYPAACFEFFERKEIGHTGNDFLINLFTTALPDESARSRSNVNLLLELLNSQLLNPIRSGDFSNTEHLRAEVLFRAEYLYVLNNIKSGITKCTYSDVAEKVMPILDSLIRYITTCPSIMNDEMHQKIRFFIQVLSFLQEKSFTQFHDSERRVIQYCSIALFRGIIPSNPYLPTHSLHPSLQQDYPTLPSSSLSTSVEASSSQPVMPQISSFALSPQADFRFQGDFERLRLKFEVLEALGGPALQPIKQSNNLSCIKLLHEMRDLLKSGNYDREIFVGKFNLLPLPIQTSIKLYFASYCSFSGPEEEKLAYAQEKQFHEAYFLQMRKSFNAFMQSPEMLETLKKLDTLDPLSHTKQVSVKFNGIESVNLVDRSSYLDEMNSQTTVNFHFQLLFNLITGSFTPEETDQNTLKNFDFYGNVNIDTSSNCFPPIMRKEDVIRSWDWQANSIKETFSLAFMKVFSNELILNGVLEKIESSKLPFDAKTAAYGRIDKIKEIFLSCIDENKVMTPNTLLDQLF